MRRGWGRRMEKEGGGFAGRVYACNCLYPFEHDEVILSLAACVDTYPYVYHLAGASAQIILCWHSSCSAERRGTS